MKLLTSPLGMALIAALINIGMTTSMIMTAMNQVATTPTIEPPEKTLLPERMWNFRPQEIDKLISELKSARDEAKKEEKSVVTLKAQVTAEKAEIEAVRTDIQRLRAEIEERVLEIKDSELKNLKTLAQTYSLLKVPEAVIIFREMPEDMAVKLLWMMKTDKVAPILGEMSKAPTKPGEESMARRAARISDKLRLIKPQEKKTP